VLSVLSVLSVIDVAVCCHVLSVLSVLDVAVGAWCLQGVCRCSWTAGCMWLTRVTTATLQASLAYLLCLHATSRLCIHMYTLLRNIRIFVFLVLFCITVFAELLIYNSPMDFGVFE
jgi:hypothetical protein